MQNTAFEIDRVSGNGDRKMAAGPHGGANGHSGIEKKIREFIAQNLLFSEDGFPFQNDDSFLQNGVIDSLGVLELVTLATREFGLQVEPAEVTPENFDSVSRLATYIRRKQNSATEANGARS